MGGAPPMDLSMMGGAPPPAPPMAGGGAQDPITMIQEMLDAGLTVDKIKQELQAMGAQPEVIQQIDMIIQQGLVQVPPEAAPVEAVPPPVQPGAVPPAAPAEAPGAEAPKGSKNDTYKELGVLNEKLTVLSQKVDLLVELIGPKSAMVGSLESILKDASEKGIDPEILFEELRKDANFQEMIDAASIKNYASRLISKM